MIQKNVLFIAAALVLVSCTSQIQNLPGPGPKSNTEVLGEQISGLCSDPNLFNAAVGVYIESAEHGDILFQQNEHKLFIPASNMKLFTTAIALLKLGPDFRYKTPLYARGPVKNGILSGDLIVRGSGDPTISSRYANGDVRNLLIAWADSLKTYGVHRITGNLIGDVSYFQNNPLGAGWEWDDEPYWYAAPMGALTLNDNCIDITVMPNSRTGLPPEVTMSPPTAYVQIQNNALTTEPDSVNSIHITRQRFNNIVIIENQLPQNFRSNSESISVIDPGLYFLTVLREVLESAGITVDGNLTVVEKPNTAMYSDTQKLFTHASPALHEIIAVINKRSQNLYAEQLLLTLAAEYAEQANASQGAKVVMSLLNRMGIPDSEFLMYDGSGLSRKNLISPLTTATLLRYMAKHSYFQYWLESLPVGGSDGTLSSRMHKSAATGNVYAKTGYVSHVRNLSGYARSAEGEFFIFSILVNHYTLPTPAINLLQDRICERLSAFSRN